MRFKLGSLLAAAILVASCGAEEPMLDRDYKTNSVQENSEDALANLEEQKAMCLSEEACSPIQFDLTILKNGEIEDENGQVTWDSSTLIAEEGIDSLWHFQVSSNLKIPDNREFRFVVEADVGFGIDLQQKVFNSFVFDVNSSEKAGNIPVKVQDITYCLLSNDRDYCENYATDDELRTQLIMVPFMVAKKDNMLKALACTAGDIATIIPGDTALIGSIAKILLGCR